MLWPSHGTDNLCDSTIEVLFPSSSSTFIFKFMFSAQCQCNFCLLLFIVRERRRLTHSGTLVHLSAKRYEAGDEARDDEKCRRRSGDEADTTLQCHEEWTRVNCNDVETSNFDCLTSRRIYWNIDVLDCDPWATEPNHIDWGYSNLKTQLRAVPLRISSRTARSKTVQEYLDTCNKCLIYLFNPRQENWKYDLRFTRSRRKVANAGPAQQLIRIDCWRRHSRPAISTKGWIGLPLFKFNEQAAFWKHYSFRDLC